MAAGSPGDESFGGLAGGIVTVNALSDLSDAAGRGRHLLAWKPLIQQGKHHERIAKGLRGQLHRAI